MSMMRLAYLSLTLGFLVAPACKDIPNGGMGGMGGTAGGAAGAGGTAAGQGGRGGATGAGGFAGAVLTGCPPGRPMANATCSGSFACSYDVMCICGVCCQYGYQCTNGALMQTGFNDACTQLNPEACRDGGGDGNADARGAVCTPGANQSCNDNPATSSIRGTCIDAGTCVCNNDASPNPASGRCP